MHIELWRTLFFYKYFICLSCLYKFYHRAVAHAQVGPGFNRDYWARFEKFVKDVVKKADDVWIATGPVFAPAVMPDGSLNSAHRYIGVSLLGACSTVPLPKPAQLHAMARPPSACALATMSMQRRRPLEKRWLLRLSLTVDANVMLTCRTGTASHCRANTLLQSRLLRASRQAER